MYASLPAWLRELLPILVLLSVISFVVIRLPKVDVGHTDAYRRRRFLNWFPAGLTYAFLYFGRYNLTAFKNAVGMTNEAYGTIGMWGSIVYGFSFLLNGPLADRIGGRATLLIAAVGSAAMNGIMGVMALNGWTENETSLFAALYAGNMYFQSFGAVSIVKVNSAWFHLRERGTFGGIFGILISLGLYFAFDIGKRITEELYVEWLFLIPAMILALFFVLSWMFVRNNPSDTGHPDFDLGDATQAGDGDKLPITQVFIKLLTHPVILVIALIELCSGFLRQAILQWGTDFGKGVVPAGSFVFDNWGMVSCIAGITGGMFAGAISDHMFNSRRSPVSAVLYGIMVAGALIIIPLFSEPKMIGWVVAIMSMAIIGVHGMLTATASADFAGKRNTGTAVGLIDGFVYVGATAQSFLYGAFLPASKIRDANNCLVPNPASGDVDNWVVWPIAMIPVALIGFGLSLRIWNAKPKRGGGGGH